MYQECYFCQLLVESLYNIYTLVQISLSDSSDMNTFSKIVNTYIYTLEYFYQTRKAEIVIHYPLGLVLHQNQKILHLYHQAQTDKAVLDNQYKNRNHHSSSIQSMTRLLPLLDVTYSHALIQNYDFGSAPWKQNFWKSTMNLFKKHFAFFFGKQNNLTR